ncbi:putative Ig domain-containing protein [Streptomyces flavotricini]|uniref:putative Ig domain-containing protein n=1 Tax=Streptomyces flavotricini TaxID=66888 RepID=UPI0027E35AA2|nr:putative Ig domain-containing protein [Streptomyces flavotricini]
MQVQPDLHHPTHHHRRQTHGKPTLHYTATGLPFGLTIDTNTGRITGKPWTTGTLQITATATDSTPTTATTTFPLTVTWF